MTTTAPVNPAAGRARRLAAATRRSKLLARRMAKASTPNDRVSVAADYLRSLLKVAPPELAESVGSATVDQILARAEQLESLLKVAPGGTR